MKSESRMTGKTTTRVSGGGVSNSNLVYQSLEDAMTNNSLGKIRTRKLHGLGESAFKS